METVICLSATANAVIKAGLEKSASRKPAETREKRGDCLEARPAWLRYGRAINLAEQVGIFSQRRVHPAATQQGPQ
jgi:hypothetical protein